jgi:N-acetylglucosaminyldiphosphoundecaprenol N-acetyl-beta-D-mannosaminyltransferase
MTTFMYLSVHSLVQRAPILLQKIGLEWLWRIKEEPYLWKRYWDDGLGLISLTLKCILPLFAHYRWRKLTGFGSDQFKIHYTENPPRSVLVSIAGAAIERHIDAAIDGFRKAIEGENDIEIDLSNLRVIDPRFFGLLLMVRKLSIRRGFQLQFSNATPRIKKMFRLNGFEYLLNAER